MNSSSTEAYANPASPLTREVIGCAMKIHRTLGPGFLESVYQQALCHELAKGGIAAVSQKPIPVLYDGVVVGDFFADLAIEDSLIIELKAVEKLAPIHEVQTVNYLTATGIDTGLLINFGGSSLEFKRKTRKRNPTKPSQDS